MITEGKPEVTDYVVVTNAYAEYDAESTRALEWFDPPRQIHGDIWIGQLDQDFCTALLNASDRRGENWDPYRQYGCSYAFYRKNAPAGPGHELHFDADQGLYTCVALSRIVHPTSVGFERAVRVLEWRNGARKIVPVERPELNAYAFVTDPNENWLIPGDLPALRDLLQAVEASPPMGRLATAMWHHEAVARHYFMDLRWPLLATCLEAMVRIRDERLPSGRFAGSTQVFVDRLLAIGAADLELRVAEDDLRLFYQQRSLLTHGLTFGGLGATEKALYRMHECFARGIIRKAILDAGFRATFASDAKLASNLPLRAVPLSR